ncbi:hypothetical protein PVAG01_11394 [Phlyctema vagabunda]|uniref:Rhodopsin domain-containing protein n=1 Tax=Phlyctema vagabunda TaxID=108571 RepID=A0ABR4P260_9HELO
MSTPMPPELSMPGSMQSLQYGCYIIYALAMVVVGLRIYTRSKIIGWLGWDDYLILVAALSSTAIVVTVPFMFNLGIGLHIGTLTDHEIFYGRRAAWISQIFYYFALVFIKCSIVALYSRLVSKHMHLIVLYTLGTLIMLHGLIISANQITAHMCSPVSIIWGPTFPAHCIDLLTFNYFNAAFHILTDILLGVLPIPVLRTLQLSRRKKLALATVFGAGLLTIAATVARQVYNFIALTGPDFSWTWAPTELVTNLEINMGIICASVPALQTLYRSLAGAESSRGSSYPSASASASAHGKISSLSRSKRRASSYSDGYGIREIERVRNRDVEAESGHDIIFQGTDEDENRRYAVGNSDPWSTVGMARGAQLKTTVSGSTMSPSNDEASFEMGTLQSGGVMKTMDYRVEYEHAM